MVAVVGNGWCRPVCRGSGLWAAARGPALLGSGRGRPAGCSQSSRPIAAAMVLTACRMAAAVPRTAAVIASVSVVL